MIRTYRKIPVKVEAVEWTGDNFGELIDFTEYNFRTSVVGEFTAEVYDRLHCTWISVSTGDMIVRGVTNEFYPVERKVFDRTYELDVD